jgi:transposase
VLYRYSPDREAEHLSIASLITSARLNRLDPEAYLHEVLGRIADHPVSRFAELLPFAVGTSPL